MAAGVARLVVRPQESYSDERQLYVDEKLSFTPWHSLTAHQPLGGIMRARKKAYGEAAAYRGARNQRVLEEPASGDVVPR